MPSLMSAGYSISKCKWTCFVKSNMSLSLLERYKSGGKSFDESLLATLNYTFCVVMMVLNSTVTGGFASRAHLLFLFKVLIKPFMSE